MTALGLAGSEDWGMGWFVETTAWETDLPAYFSLRFYLEDETGGMVELDWFYNDSDTADESWFGFWTIETVLDGPSYVTLDSMPLWAAKIMTKQLTRYIWRRPTPCSSAPAAQSC